MVGFRLAILVWFASSVGWAQTNRHVISFKDKNNTPFSIQQPQAFLSTKALKRRSHSSVAVTSDDLPVTPSYITQVRATGAQAFYTSRWMNALLVEASDAQIASISALPFVSKTEMVAPGKKLLGGRSAQGNQVTATSSEVTSQQLQMLGLDKMHNDGFYGEGITISILDDGFIGVSSALAFQGVNASGQIKMTQDFVSNSGNVYQFDGHGTEVFSIIGAQLQGTFTGGAYHANYLLFVTEDVSSEYRIEEYNWLFAAEKADSAGTDIIQSSLGYNLFDDPNMDYAIAQLDGKTAIVSRAASMARDRAIVVVVSAGNEGQNGWHYVTPPADADGILATGAVTSTGLKAGFSSFGPTADGRIKPDVVAMGQSTAVILPGGTTGTGNGTSLASPLVTSLVAGLLQAYPTLKPSDLIQAIKLSADQSGAPNNAFGFGLPNYVAVKNYLESITLTQDVMLYPNPAETTMRLAFNKLPEGPVNLSFYDAQGRLLLNSNMTLTWSGNPLDISLSNLGAGMYFLKVNTSVTVITLRFMKL